MKYSQAQNVKDILSAITSVKARAAQAVNAGNITEFSTLAGDLFALEQCLVYQTGQLIEDLDEVA